MKNPDLKSKYEQFYFRQAAEQVAKFNAERPRYLKEVVAQKLFLCLIAIFFLSILAAWLLTILPFSESVQDRWLPLIGIFGLFGASVLLGVIRYLAPTRMDFTSVDAESELKNKLMPDFMRIFGDFSWSKMGADLVYDFRALRQTKIVPENITAEADDCIQGTYNGVGIKITEMSIGKNALILWLALVLFLPPVSVIVFMIVSAVMGLIAVVSGSAVLTFILFGVLGLSIVVGVVGLLYYVMRYLAVAGKFYGVMIELDMPKTFSGHTFIYEKALSAQALRNSTKTGYTAVNLEDVEFMRRYTVYSDNQVEARYVLTPMFMERLKNISLAFKAKYLRMSFKNNKMVLLAATNKDLFMMGSAFKDSDKTTFDVMFAEICSVLGLIDELRLQKRI